MLPVYSRVRTLSGLRKSNLGASKINLKLFRRKSSVSKRARGSSFGATKTSTLLVLVGSLLFGVVVPLPFANAATKTTGSYITAPTTTSVVLTITNGTFTASEAQWGNFTFAGADSARFSAANLATLTLTSSTKITFGNLSGMTGGTNNTIAAAAQATCTGCSVAAVSSLSNITSAAYVTASTTTSVTITLPNGTFKASGIVAANFVFAGTDAARLALGTFTRTSATVVTITGLTLTGVANNTVTVPAAIQLTQATSVAGAAVALITRTITVSATTTSSIYNGSGYSATPSLSATPSAGAGSITYAVTNGTSTTCNVGAILAGGTLTSNTAGTCLINATIASDGTYIQVISTVPVTFTFNLAPVAGSLLTLTAPVTGATPATTGGNGTGFTGSVAWFQSDGTTSLVGNFVATTVYVAKVTISAATNYTLTGLTGSFTNSGTSSVTYSGGVVTITFSATGSQLSQSTLSIVVSPNTAAAGTSQAITITPTGGSGSGATTYAVANGTATGCSLLNTTASNTISGTTAGTCTITATKAADSTYSSTTATASFTYTLATQATLTAAQVTSSAIYNGSAYSATPSFSTTGGSGTGAVTYTVADGSATTCALSSSAANATLTAATNGTCTITATKAADATYAAATGTVTFTFNLAPVAGSLLTLTAPVTGATPATTGGNGTGFSGSVAWFASDATTPLVGNFVATTVYVAKVTISAATNYTLTGLTGSFTNSGTSSVTYSGGVVTLTFSATGSQLSQSTLIISTLGTSSKISPYSQALSITTTGGSGTGAISYSIVSGGTAITCALSDSTSIATISATTAGTCLVQATKSADGTYAAVTSASATFTFVIATSGTLTISSLGTSAKAFPYSQVLSITTTGGNGTGAVTYAIVSGGTATTCALSDSSSTATITATTPGTCLVQASKAADANFTSSTSASETFTFTIATSSVLSISSLGTSTKAFPYSQVLSITTTGGSGTGAVTYAIVTGGTATTCALSNSSSTATITATTAGTCLIQATKAADGNYTSATSTSVTFTFVTGNVSVTFNVNSGSGTMDVQTTNVATNLSTNTFTRAGYTFDGWSLTVDGALAYANNASYPFAASATLYARWAANTSHTVNYSAGSATVTGTTPSQAAVVEGLTFTIAANTFTRTGYSFTSWISSGSAVDPISYSAGSSYTMGLSNVTLTAQWSALPLATVTFSPNDGGGVAYTQQANVSTNLIANAFTRVGFTFGGWSRNPAPDTTLAYANNASYPFTSSSTLYAIWNQGTRHSVTYALNGGSGTIPLQPPVSEGLSFTIADGATLTKTGFVFSSWSDGTNSYIAGDSYTMSTSSITLTAQWTQAGSFAVTYSLEGGPGTAPKQADVVDGLSFTVAAKPAVRPGYTFNSWSDGTTNFVPGSTYTITRSNVQLSAIWAPNPSHTVTYVINLGLGATTSLTTGLAPSQADVLEGASFIVADHTGFTRAGYAFARWTDGSTNYDPGATVTMGGNNFVLEAVWTANPIRNVTYSLDGGTGTLPIQDPVAQGLTFKVADSAGLSRAGFVFSNWTNGLVAYAAGATYTASTVDITLTAVWKAVPLRTITYSLNGGTGTLPTQIALAEGATFTLADEAGITEAANTFSSWLIGTITYAPGASFKVGTTNITITAQWSAVPPKSVTYALGNGAG
ncbi:MAG: hypothetical protein D4R69_01870, partial [Actinomycetales bacterium]